MNTKIKSTIGDTNVVDILEVSWYFYEKNVNQDIPVIIKIFSQHSPKPYNL